MDFDLTDDQRMLKDSVNRLVADNCGFEQRKAILKSPEGWSRTNWAKLAELGLLGVNLPEEQGGFGGGPLEMMLVADAFGRALAVEPFFATCVLGAGLLRHAGKIDEVAAVAAGEMLLAFAHHERQARYDLSYVTTSAMQMGDGWEITGEKSLVLHGDCADKIIVSARVSGAVGDEAGIGLFLMNASGLKRRGYATQDALRAAEISFEGSRAEAVLSLDGFSIISRVVDEAIAFLCAEALGAMEDMHTTTVEYLKTRKQFGRAIGEFQVLQHRAVDMLVQLELARSMVLYATMMASDDDAGARRRAISAAKVQVGNSARHVGQEAIQLHGGIAMTMEYKVGHHFKRLTMIEKMFGDTETHLRRLSAEGTAF